MSAAKSSTKITKTAKANKPIPTSPQNEFLKWLEDSVFKVNTSYAKKRLIRLDDIISQARKTKPKPKCIPMRWSMVWRAGRRRKEFDINEQLVEKYIAMLTKKNKVQASEISIPSNNGRTFYSHNSIYVSCKLPDETIAEHKARHDELVRLKKRRLMANIRAVKIVNSEESVKKLVSQLKISQKVSAQLNREFTKRLKTFTENLAASIKNGVQPVEDTWDLLKTEKKDLEEARAQCLKAAVMVADKKAELLQLRNTLRKPVKELVRNPAAMNL